MASTGTNKRIQFSQLQNMAPFVASGASHIGGAVPDPGVTSGTTKYLREDATWAVPLVELSWQQSCTRNPRDSNVLIRQCLQAVRRSEALHFQRISLKAGNIIRPGTMWDGVYSCTSGSPTHTPKITCLVGATIGYAIQTLTPHRQPMQPFLMASMCCLQIQAIGSSGKAKISQAILLRQHVRSWYALYLVQHGDMVRLLAKLHVDTTVSTIIRHPGNHSSANVGTPSNFSLAGCVID